MNYTFSVFGSILSWGLHRKPNLPTSPFPHNYVFLQKRTATTPHSSSGTLQLDCRRSLLRRLCLNMLGLSLPTFTWSGPAIPIPLRCHVFRKRTPLQIQSKTVRICRALKDISPARDLHAVYRMDRGGHTSTERKSYGPIPYQMQEHTYLSLQNDLLFNAKSLVYNRLARTRSSTGSSDKLYPRISETPLSRTLHVEKFPSPESTF